MQKNKAHNGRRMKMGSNEAKKIYETIVKYNKQKFDTKLTITEKTIELEKKKGLLKNIQSN